MDEQEANQHDENGQPSPQGQAPATPQDPQNEAGDQDPQAIMDREDAAARAEIQGAGDVEGKADEQPIDEALETQAAPEGDQNESEPAETSETSETGDDADAEPEEQAATESFRDPAALVEAILFTTDAPLAPAKIVQVSELPGVKVVKQAVKALNEKYEQMGCSFRIEEIGGGFQMMTLPEYHDVLGRLSKARSDTKLSQAGLETLAIIAYRQPILRADIEAIRGVASGEILRTLMEKQLVKIVGRAEVIGRPMLYGTTRKFLDVFGLANLEDLPRVEELKAGARKPAAKPETPNEPAAAEATAPVDQPAKEATGQSNEPATEATDSEDQSVQATWVPEDHASSADDPTTTTDDSSEPQGEMESQDTVVEPNAPPAEDNMGGQYQSDAQ